MGWFIAFICVLVILVVVFNASQQKRSKNNIHKPIRDKKSDLSRDTLPEPSNSIISKDAPSKYKNDRKQRTSKQVGPYGHGQQDTRTHVRYDRQKILDESILTPFSEELSQASHLLHEAYKLEKEGATQEKIQEVLEKARQADKDATALYIGRMSIIRKVRNKRLTD
ncbi:hypothetical protein ACFLXK_03480 [Chloroflexota bacterium]